MPVLLAVLSLVGLTWMVGVLPYWIGPTYDQPVSEAQFAGYHNATAHLAATLWLVATACAAWWLTHAARNAPPALSLAPPRPWGQLRDWCEIAIFAGLYAAVFYPPALLHYGPFVEENIHLNAIQRMMAGDTPFVDFEFLYAPLMLYAPYSWMTMFGYGLESLYWYTLIVDGLAMVALLIVVQLCLRPILARLIAFGLLAMLSINVLLGPNQGSLRKIGGALLLFSIARAPGSRIGWIVHGILLGLLLAYSHDFGAATAIGCAGIYLSLAVKQQFWPNIFGLASIALISGVTWMGCLVLLLGADWRAYIDGALYLAARYDEGEAAFSYVWTLNSFAGFLLAAAGAVIVGRSLAQTWSEPPAAGDLLLIGGFAYMLVALKSGLGRQDMWHLVPAFFPLALALLAGVPRRGPPTRDAVIWAGGFGATVLALTFVFGQLIFIRWIALEGVAKGYAALAHRDGFSQNALSVPPLHPMVETERARVNAADRDLAEVLNREPMRGRRIFPYGVQIWKLGTRGGVAKTGPMNDDFIFGDARGEQMRMYLAAHPGVLVVMARDEFDQLRTMPNTPVKPEPTFRHSSGYLGVIDTAQRVLSSVHYDLVEIEETLKIARWHRLVGVQIMDLYEPIYRNSDYVVLERRAP